VCIYSIEFFSLQILNKSKFIHLARNRKFNLIVVSVLEVVASFCLAQCYVLSLHAAECTMEPVVSCCKQRNKLDVHIYSKSVSVSVA